MKVLGVLMIVVGYPVATYVLGRVFSRQLGWVYGRRFGLRCDDRVMLHVWLALLLPGVGLSYALIYLLLGEVATLGDWGAVLLLAVFSPVLAMIGVSKRVNDHILEGYTQWKQAAVSRFTT